MVKVSYREYFKSFIWTRAVVQLIGKIEEKELRYQELWGQDHRGVPSSTKTTPPPPPQLSSTTSGTFGERDPRRQGAQAGRLGGGQPGIGWNPSGMGGQ